MTNVFERSFLLTLGAAVLAKEMAANAVDELVKKGESASDEGKKIVEETVEQAKEQTRTLKTRLDETKERNFREAGLVTAGQLEELTLKLAQLEHRISLLEAGAPAPKPTAAGMPEGQSAPEVPAPRLSREEEAEKEALTPRLDTP